MTFENIGAKGEIAYGEQFLLWPQCFQHHLTIKLSFMEIFQVFVIVFSKSSAACGKGSTDIIVINQQIQSSRTDHITRNYNFNSQTVQKAIVILYKLPMNISGNVCCSLLLFLNHEVLLTS